MSKKKLYFTLPDGSVHRYGEPKLIGDKIYQINSDGTRTFLRYADGPQNYDRSPTGSYLRTCLLYTSDAADD